MFTSVQCLHLYNEWFKFSCTVKALAKNSFKRSIAGISALSKLQGWLFNITIRQIELFISTSIIFTSINTWKTC